ncbi:MAG: AbrB/MazE/SpoVT family DNA-binding domain-containing protein [Phycisphaerae bacterium]|nr:AbrB/MazE/SpoVT family DNA-binding domain-containing protein [Phycisphaerae bacterium]
MTKKLTKHGNSYALVIDKPILELLRITPETTLSIATDGETLMISPVRDDARRKKLRDSLAKINRKYGDDLKRLAE